MFQPGDKIKFLDELGGGLVLSILANDQVRIITDEGFELVMPAKKLIPVDRSVPILPEEKKKVQEIPFDREEVLRLKEEMFKRPQKSKPAKTITEETMEVDLHIGELLDTISGMSNAEIITIQLSHVRLKMEEAIAAHMRRIIFIHGVGNGRLKSELIKILKEDYPSCEYFDASMSKYGFGATEVRLK